MPAPFDASGVTNGRSDVKSTHRAAQARLALHAPTLKAALCVIGAGRETGHTALGKQGDYVMVERVNSKGTIDVVVFNTKNGKFNAAVFSDPDSSPEPYSIKSRDKDGTALIMAIIAASLNNAEYTECISKISTYLYDATAIKLSYDELSIYGTILCDNIYTRILSADTLGADGIKVVMPNTTNIQPIRPLSIEKGTYAPNEVVAGTFRILLQNGRRALAHPIVSNAELPRMFAFSERVFTQKEQALIPIIEPWYVIPSEVVRISQHAHATTHASQAMRNFMLRGAAGVGKTEAVSAIAAALNLPYVTITCSANSEIIDLLGQFLPDIEGMEDANTAHRPNTIPHHGLPSLEDIQMDHASAYEMLTGIYQEDISIDEVYTKLIEVIREAAIKDSDKSDKQQAQGFRYVETPLVKAMKYGYVLEIQEPSVIANPGVLVGLNSLLDRGKKITLPTGETITRHPDTVVIITTNSDYSGCREINQSVISRMNLVLDIDEPSEDDLVARVSAITGCTDIESISLMASVIKDIQRRCRKTMISDGSCGVREFISWTQSFMITRDMEESARYTVASSVSANPESREEIWNTCIAPKIAS